MAPRFTKFHGYGNDYIVLEADQVAKAGDLGALPGVFVTGITARCGRRCRRRRSENDSSDFESRIFNPDGSEAGMSGNGTRCAAAYLYFHGLWSNDLLRLQTRNGLKHYHLIERSGNGSFLFRSELGQPKLDSASIPLLTAESLDRVIDLPLAVGDETVRITACRWAIPMLHLR